MASDPSPTDRLPNDAALACEPAPPRRTPRAWLFLLLKCGLFAIVCYFVGREMLRQIRGVSWDEVQFQPGWLVLSLLAILLAMFLSVISYRILLGGFTAAPSLSAMCTVNWLPAMGKYLPGKFASVAGAIWLLRRYQVPTGIAASAVMVQQGLAVLTGLLLALPLCFWEPVRRQFPSAWMWFTALGIAGLVVLHPRVLGTTINLGLRCLRREPLRVVPPLGHYLPPVFLLVVDWAVLGLATWLAAAAVTEVSPPQLVIFTGAIALASSLGVLTLIPGGLGVREAVLLIVLTPLTGQVTAIVAVLMRLLVMLAEVLLALLALLIVRRLREPESSDERDSLARA